LVVNRLRGVLNVAAVKAHNGDRRKAMLEDIVVLTGGQLITEGLKLENCKLDMLGKARRMATRITKDTTRRLLLRQRTGCQGRCERIRRQMDETNSSYDKEKLQERLARPGWRCRCMVKVGAD